MFKLYMSFFIPCGFSVIGIRKYKLCAATTHLRGPCGCTLSCWHMAWAPCWSDQAQLEALQHFAAIALVCIGCSLVGSHVHCLLLLRPQVSSMSLNIIQRTRRASQLHHMIGFMVLIAQFVSQCRNQQASVQYMMAAALLGLRSGGHALSMVRTIL